MLKLLFIAILFCLLTPSKSLSQTFATQSAALVAPYHPPSQDKISWQRLLLLLSSTYWHVVKEGQVDLDNGLLHASRSLGLSRLPVIAEGIDDAVLVAESKWVDHADPQNGIRLLSQATGKKRVELLVLLGAYYAFQPYSYHRYRDSVEYFLTRAINESKTIREKSLAGQALCLLGKMYVQANDLVKGDSVFNQAINDSRAAADKETEARAFAYRGLYTAYSPGSTADRILYLQKARDIYQQLKDTEGEINVLTNAGYLYVTTLELKNGYDALTKALALEEAINFPYIHYNTDALAMITLMQAKFGEPFKYALQTINVAETNRDSIGWSYFYNRLGVLYLTEGGRDDESLKWMQKSLDRFIITRDPSLYLNLNNIVVMMGDKGYNSNALDLVIKTAETVPPESFFDSSSYHLALATSYTGLGQLDLAEMHLVKADFLETKAAAFRGPFRRAPIAGQFGFINLHKGQYSKARAYFNQYLNDITRGGQSVRADFNIYAKLIFIDSVLHDDVSMLAHYKRYNRLLDSTFRVSKLRQAEELQVLYLTQEKESQITVLNQKAKLEEAKLTQSNLLKNVTIGGIIVALIIAGLLYRQNRLKQRSNNVITHKNELLQHFLTEKEWLLKEIHHRVKNNLQIVMSLLNSQSAYIENDAALTAIHDSQHRVHAMSLIHQKLYNAENVSSIDMSSYIRELVSYLSDSYNTGQRILFEFDIEPLELDVSQAIPLGLILNEAITNSIKYAFPDERHGLINISLSNTSVNQYLLIISDNGIGMPSYFTRKKAGSLGMSLMAGLSEDLDGSFTVENNDGTTIKISFVHDLNVKRPDIVASSFVTSN